MRISSVIWYKYTVNQKKKKRSSSRKSEYMEVVREGLSDEVIGEQIADERVEKRWWLSQRSSFQGEEMSEMTS